MAKVSFSLTAEEIKVSGGFRQGVDAEIEGVHLDELLEEIGIDEVLNQIDESEVIEWMENRGYKVEVE